MLSKSQFEKPVCEFEIPGETVIDNLPGIEFRTSLKYESENGLREVGPCEYITLYHTIQTF